MADDDKELEKAKLQLEIDKHQFEVRKYDSEVDSRAEELFKLRTDRWKAESEIEDLRSPFFKKPAVITAMFQGIALVIAIVTAFISLGAWNSLRDAAIAKQDAAIAKMQQQSAQAETVRANEERQKAQSDADSATESTQQAKTEAESAQRLKVLADADVRQAKQDAELASVRQILAGLKEQKYYPLFGPNQFQVGGGEDHRTTDIKLLMNAIECVIPACGKRVDFLHNYALQTSDSLDGVHPLGVRLTVLRILYQESIQGSLKFKLNPVTLRSEFLEVATSIHEGKVDESVLNSLLAFQSDPREASTILCRDYYKRYAANIDYVSQGGFRGFLETFIATKLYYQTAIDYAVTIDPNNRDCASAVWNWLSPEADSWKYSHPDSILLLLKGQEGRRELYGGSPFPEFFALVRNFQNGNPRITDKGDSVLIDIDVGGERPKEPMVWLILDYWKRADLAAEEPPAVRFGDATATLLNFKNWMIANKDIVDLISEAKLTHLRGCEPQLLENLRKNEFIGRNSIEKNCPKGTLSH